MALITGVKLPARAQSVLEAILDRLGLPTARITSVARTPERQAVAMLDNCLKGISEQFEVYKGPGDAVIQIVDNWAKVNRPGLLKQMESKINEVGPSNVSHHCLPLGSPLEVFDLAQNAIPAARHLEFIAACKADPSVAKILVENSVFHIEVSKAVPAVKLTT